MPSFPTFIWPNTLSSVSRHRAPRMKSEIPALLRPSVLRTHNIENFIQFHRPCRNLSIWRRAIFDKFRPTWPWPWSWLWVKILLSCITHWPLPTYQVSSRADEKSEGGRTDDQRTEFSRWSPFGDDVTSESIRSFGQCSPKLPSEFRLDPVVYI